MPITYAKRVAGVFGSIIGTPYSRLYTRHFVTTISPSKAIGPMAQGWQRQNNALPRAVPGAIMRSLRAPGPQRPHARATLNDVKVRLRRMTEVFRPPKMIGRPRTGPVRGTPGVKTRKNCRYRPPRGSCSHGTNDWTPLYGVRQAPMRHQRQRKPPIGVPAGTWLGRSGRKSQRKCQILDENDRSSPLRGIEHPGPLPNW